MKASIKKLQNIFNLESDRGYDNGAVLGGLDRMLESWEAEARAEALDDELILAVLTRLRDYSRLTPASREEMLKGLWRRVRSEEEVAPPPEERLPASPARPAEPDGAATAPAAPGVSAPETPTPVPAPEAKPERTEGPPAGPTTAPAPQAELEPEMTERPPDAEAEPIEAPEGPQERAREAAEAPASAPAPTPAAPQDGPPADLDAPVTVIPGIGDRHSQTLQRLGLHTLGDMLRHFPRRYDDYTEIQPINKLWYGQDVTVIGTVKRINLRDIHSRKLKIVEALVTDGSGTLRVTWFNQPWIARRLKGGTPVVLSGKVEQYLGRLTMSNPEWELLERDNLHTNRIVPVYPLTAKLTQRWLRRMLHKVVSYWAPRVQDPLPAMLREQAGLVDLSQALLQIHFPETMEALREARHRLAFDELFLLQVGVMRQKMSWSQRSGSRFAVDDDWLDARLAALPFALTDAQQRALGDVRLDLASGRPMNRLLQGDVGSGKTVIAALAIVLVAQSDAQSALMAPTSILAEQHYASLQRLLGGPDGVLGDGQIRLMVGATSEAEKQEIREGLASNHIKLVVGTHALIEDPVAFKELELVVIDEQHRFGVRQRAALREKGTDPHLLVMTATPIPRSLSLTVYGDLDLSVLDEMPPGRMEVDTHILYPIERERAYTLVEREINKGGQAFIIYPLVEESDSTEAKAAVEEHERLRQRVFPRHKLGLLHGRLRPDEKESVMAAFRDRELDILVSTSVVEVGVDIPNATVMIIEGANRFGLAQLHQFRGRVGRGAQKSYCLLIPDADDAAENERLAAMVETNDGFVLAERDLEQRGPGEFLGTRQSGFAELRLASLTDVSLIEKTRRHARALVEADPELIHPENELLAQALAEFWAQGTGDIS